MRIGGHACHTNIPSNTAMRGFGMPQALMMTENVLLHIADTLGVERALVQELNLLRDGDKLVYGVTVEDCTIRRCWNTLKDICGYEKRKNDVAKFNK